MPTLLAVIGFAMLFLPMPWRFWATNRLMRAYAVREYLSNPAARRLWIANFGLAFLAPLGLVLLGIASRIWWVTAATTILAGLIVWRLAWKIHIRLSGNYLEYYRAAQWSGPRS